MGHRPDDDGSTRSWALLHGRELGPVFPCRPNKVPLIKDWHRLASREQEQIEDWWRRWPQAMVGMPTGGASGVWVLDVDTDATKAKVGLESLASLGLTPEALLDTDTVVAMTATGGMHFYWSWMLDGAPIKNSAGKVGRDLDTRGDGGYVILPGSRLADGRRYEWLRPPNTFRFQQAPERLIRLAMASSRPPGHDSVALKPTQPHAGSAGGRAVLERECAKVAATPAGARNDALNRSAFQLGGLVANGDVCEREVEDGLMAAAVENGSVADDGAAKAMATITGGLAAGKSRPISWGGGVPAGLERHWLIEDFDTLEPRPLPWLVKDLWPAVGLCFVAGPSRSGKTFWVLRQLAHICRGEAVLGRRSAKMGCIYIAAEAAAGVRSRITGLRQQIGALDAHFGFVAEAPNLTMPGVVDWVRRELTAARDAQAARGVALGMVVLDTLSAVTAGADESTARDMAPVLDALQRIARDLDLLVLVVAHTGKDLSRGLRGWSGLFANADGVIMLDEPGEDAVRTGKVDKVKDGPAGDAFAFRLEAVDLGLDADGDRMTTCIAAPAALPGRAGDCGDHITGQRAVVMQAVLRCLQERQGVEATSDGTIGVLRSAVKEMAVALGYADDDDNPDTIKRTINRNITHLIGAGRLRGNKVWVTPTPFPSDLELM